jgi:hypothetical protein
VGYSVERPALVFMTIAVLGMTSEFRAIWEIDIDAEGPKEASQQAQAIQLTPGMSATVFEVWEHLAGKCTGSIWWSNPID